MEKRFGRLIVETSTKAVWDAWFLGRVYGTGRKDGHCMMNFCTTLTRKLHDSDYASITTTTTTTSSSSSSSHFFAIWTLATLATGSVASSADSVTHTSEAWGAKDAAGVDLLRSQASEVCVTESALHTCQACLDTTKWRRKSLLAPRMLPFASFQVQSRMP